MKIEDAKIILKSNIIMMKISLNPDSAVMIDAFETLLNHIERLEKGEYVKLMQNKNNEKTS